MTTPLELIPYILSFLFGITTGSFLNVCIYRIPRNEGVVVTRSHCMSCGYQLEWYDLVPIVSYLCLGGKCRKCKVKLSAQYPLIEAANGIWYLIVVICLGFQIDSIFYCLMGSALLALSVIDFRTYEIPPAFPLFIGGLGVIHLVFDWENWLEYLIGAACVSGCLLVLFLISRGRAIGGGDVKLMAACGLLIGWKLVIFAFLVGCVLGSVIHLIRMKISQEGHMLAMGPYLSAGVMLAVLWGDRCINWYLSMLS